MAAAEIAGTGVVQFYDNGDEIDGDAGSVLDVDRVYGIHYDMTPAQWRRLDEIYRVLPGGSVELGSAAWFGVEGAAAGWLVASVEPSGLQVSGRLPVAEWRRWTAAFQAAIDGTDFPRIDYGGSS